MLAWNSAAEASNHVCLRIAKVRGDPRVRSRELARIRSSADPSAQGHGVSGAGPRQPSGAGHGMSLMMRS